jgi:Tfp pilus assembly protein PilW
VRLRGQGAFTLAEMMVGMAAGALILLGLTLASISLQRSFSSGDAYATAQDSQLRVMDYLTRDLRRASTATPSGDGTQVTLTVPDYYDSYDASGNPSPRSSVNSQPRDPVLTTGAPVFGSYNPIITYYVDTTTQSLIRQIDWQVSGVAKQSKTVIADGIANFIMNITPYSNSVIQAQITFLPKFERNSLIIARAGTTLNATVTLRNVLLQ